MRLLAGEEDDDDLCTMLNGICTKKSDRVAYFHGGNHGRNWATTKIFGTTLSAEHRVKFLIECPLAYGSFKENLYFSLRQATLEHTLIK